MAKWPKYVVTVIETKEHQITVSARNGFEAEDKAYRVGGFDLNQCRTESVEKCEEENA